MSDPTEKFCLDHPQKRLQIFQVSGKAGRFGLVKPGHLPNFSPSCLFLGGTFKIVIDIAKKKVQTFFNSTMFRGVLWTPSYINSPWCLPCLTTYLLPLMKTCPVRHNSYHTLHLAFIFITLKISSLSAMISLVT